VNLIDKTVRFLPDHDEAYRVPGGTHRIITSLANSLGSKLSQIQFNSVLVSVILRPDQLLELTFRTPLGDKVIIAEKTILTLPLNTLAKIDIRVPEITDRIKVELAQSSFGQNTKLTLYFDEKHWKKYNHSASGVSDHGYQFWDSSEGQAGKAGTITAYLGEMIDPKGREEKVQQILGDLETLFPGLKQHYKGRRFFSWPSSYSGVPKPGELTRLGKTTVATNPNPNHRVFLAGEHWGEGAGYMNAAVDSAQKTVTAAAASLLNTSVSTLTTQFGLGFTHKCSRLFSQ
jgi:monoamine oxidase